MSSVQYLVGVNEAALKSGAITRELFRQAVKTGAHGRYRRPSFTPFGERIAGAYDEIVYPVRSHDAAFSKGFMLVELLTAEPLRESDLKEVAIPDDIAPFILADRSAYFTRNDQRSIFSVKRYTQRIRDGWKFDGWANENELRRIAEARPPVEAA